VDLGGFGALHAPFFMERRTRGLVQRCVAGNPGPGLAPMAIFAVSLLPQLAAGRLDKGGTDWYWFSVDGVPPDFRFAIDRQVEERMEDKTAEPEQSLKVATQRDYRELFSHFPKPPDFLFNGDQVHILAPHSSEGPGCADKAGNP
jgi:hypothetical protein